MAAKSFEKPCCRSALHIVFKGRTSPPEFVERRVPPLGNTFVTERSSCQGKRSHSHGICCSGKDSVDEDSKIKNVELSTQAEPVSGFLPRVVVLQQPETPIRKQRMTNHMAQCMSQSPAIALTNDNVSTSQQMVESPSWMTMLPATCQQSKHVIALCQLLDQAGDHQIRDCPAVRPIALDALVTAGEIARSSTPPAQLSASGAAFGTASVDGGAVVGVNGVVASFDAGSCKGVTLIVRNIPRHILQEHVLTQLRSDGFSFGTGRLDLALLYAPAVFGGSLGKPQCQGFGFVHANSSDAARALMARWHRQPIFGTAREMRALDVSKAHVQGVQANLAQWSHTKTRRIRNSRFQPYIADGVLALEASTDPTP